MNQQSSNPPLRVVAQSVSDPTHFTESMPIHDLVQTLTQALNLKRVFVQVQHPEGYISLQPVGSLAVTFVRDPQPMSQEASEEPSTPEVSSLSSEGDSPEASEASMREDLPPPKGVTSFWGLGKGKDSK